MNKKIKLSLLGALIAGSALAITLPIVSCSASSDVALTVVDASLNTVTADMTGKFNKAMTDALDNAAQVALAESWKVGDKISADNLTVIKNDLKFTDADGKEIFGTDVIENVEYFTKTTVGVAGSSISGPKLRVIFKSGYTSDKEVSIQVGSLGTAK
ncbi:MAG: hypothetical protein ACRC8C_01715 [Mycoplasmoidaceae bacterium]